MNPRSRRFCIDCNEITTFEYNQKTFHSHCRQCKGTQALNPNNKTIIRKVKQRNKNPNEYYKRELERIKRHLLQRRFFDKVVVHKLTIKEIENEKEDNTDIQNTSAE